MGVGGYSSGPGRARRGAPPRADARARTERRAGLDQPPARAVGAGGRRDLRADAVVLRKEGLCRRQSRSTPSSSKASNVRSSKFEVPAGPDPWRLPGRARNQRGHGGGGAASWCGARLMWRWSIKPGERDLAAVREEYRRAGIPARAEPFLDPVAARNGRGRPRDLAARARRRWPNWRPAGRPAVLVPFPAATDDHQRRNAEVLEQAGAAVLLEERRPDAGSAGLRVRPTCSADRATARADGRRRCARSPGPTRPRASWTA